jgi:uncharacterized membrane protein YgaE (UPF0421/DUF939 family)
MGTKTSKKSSSTVCKELVAIASAMEGSNLKWNLINLLRRLIKEIANIVFSQVIEHLEKKEKSTKGSKELTLIAEKS